MNICGLIISLALVASVAACGTVSYTEPLTNSSPSASPYSFDREKAKAFSDSIVEALIKNDRKLLRSKMEKAARDYYDQAAFDDIIDKMVAAFGAPLEFKFKKVEQGKKYGAGYDKPMLKHWYAVRTSKSDYESLNYIFVEIVPDEGSYASSGVSIVNFPMGVPEGMQ